MIGLVVSVFIIIGSVVALGWGSYKGSLERGNIALLVFFLLFGIYIFDKEVYSFLSPTWEVVLTLVGLIFLGITLNSYIRRLSN